MSDFFITNVEPIFESALLVIALSLDAFVASLAYGTNKIKIPFISVAIISIISTTVLIVSLLFGSLTKSIIPEALTRAVCFALLFFLGLFKFTDSLISAYLKKHPKYNGKFSFSLFHLKFLFHVESVLVLNDENSKKGKIMSFTEATSLALALSLDGLAAGFGAGLIDASVIQVAVFSLVFNILSVVFGRFLGSKIAEKVSFDLSWISGVALMTLAFLKLR